MDIKILLTTLGVIITIGAALPYIRDIRRGTTKPSVTTWLIWSLLAGTGSVIQLIGGGSYGSLVLATTAFMNVVILMFTLSKPRSKVSRFDLTLLGLAILTLVAWRITQNPTVSVILITLIMIMGYIPTYRKSLHAPQHETVSLFFWSAVKQIVGITALSAYNLLTLLFPVVLVFANTGLVLVIKRRRP